MQIEQLLKNLVEETVQQRLQTTSCQVTGTS
jgi:hypothetical protein